MRMYEAMVFEPTRRRILDLYPGQRIDMLIEFCGTTSEDAWNFVIRHLNERFPKARITSFDFSVRYL